jgi:hypothetical protein
MKMAYNIPLYSEITASYIEALNREGANFNYDKWYREMKQERAAAKSANLDPNDSPASSIAVSVAQTATVQSVPRMNSTAKIVHLKSETKQAASTPTMTLADVAEEAEKLQETRKRDAVYQYLNAVFKLVGEWRCRDKVNKRARRAFKAYGVVIAKDAEIYAAVFSCTADDDAVDAKTRSKWSRALRYVAKFKRRGSVTGFIKRNGGINACASLFTAHNGSR